MIPSTRSIHPIIQTTSGLIFFIISLGVFNMSQAKSNVVPVEGVSYSVASTLADNLKALQGKIVTITLDSGKDITGIVKEIGDHLLHLEKLEGKEFYDSLIRTEEISAIETRFRTIKR